MLHACSVRSSILSLPFLPFFLFFCDSFGAVYFSFSFCFVLFFFGFSLFSTAILAFSLFCLLFSSFSFSFLFASLLMASGTILLVIHLLPGSRLLFVPFLPPRLVTSFSIVEHKSSSIWPSPEEPWRGDGEEIQVDDKGGTYGSSGLSEVAGGTSRWW